MAGWCSAVGWNCTNSTSAVGTPARSAMATPSPVDSAGLVVTEKSWPAPPVASTTWSARTSTGPAVAAASGRQGQHARAAAALDQEVEREPSLEHRAGRAVGGGDERPLHLGTGGGTAGVHDARPGVAALAGQRQQARGLAVELDPEGDQLVDAPGPSSTRTRTASSSHSPAPAASVSARCRSVESSSAPSTAATPPWAQRVADWDSAPLVNTPSDSDGDGPAGTGQPHRGRQAGDATPEDQDVEGSGPGPGGHAGSFSVSSASRRADTSSITRLRPSTCTTRGTYDSSSARS